MSEDRPDTLTVGTLNLRNTADRWTERWPMMRDQLIALQPDVLGLQELRRLSRQGAMLVDSSNSRRHDMIHPYRLYPTYKTGIRRFWEGVAVLTRFPVRSKADLNLRTGNRVAQLVTIALPANVELDFYNTHLDHAPGNDELRLEQAERLLAWIDEQQRRPSVLVGDFNSQPDDPAVIAIRRRFRSAYAVIHGAEPPLTVPTPLSRNWGKEEKVLDYIFVSEQIHVHDAWVTFDDVDEAKRFAASDHFGLAARISLN